MTSHRPPTRTYYRVTSSTWSCSSIFENESDALREKGDLEAEGDTCTIEPVEMSQSEYEALPEFEGY